MSSASDRFVVMGEGNGALGDNQLLLGHHQPSHHHQIMYHVPQHSRREKLRFPADGSPPYPPPPPTSLLQLHDADVAAPSAFYHPSALPPFLSSSSSSSSSLSYYYAQNPNYCGLAEPAATQAFVDQNAQTLPPDERHHPEISPQRGFSLSLSSVPRQPHHFSVRPAPLGPFTGYAAVLNRSKFLEPARKLLEEACSAAGGGGGGGGGLCVDGEMLLDADPMEEALADHRRNGFSSAQAEPSGSQQHWKKTKLIAMLDEVYKRYKQYHQQVQDIITSFESVAGLSTAAPYASMALKIMYKNFRYLKNMISDQLCHLSKVLGKEGGSRSEDVNAFGLVSGGGSVLRSTNSAVPSIGQPHVWRPQRGLPERAVSVLRAWLFEHFLHPYPTDTDKQMLAKQTGLTRNQVSNWFINARVRLWKPMVEEVHSLDMQQRQQPAKVAGGKHARQPSSPDPSHFISEHLQVCSSAMNPPPPPPPLAKSIRQEVKQTSNPTSGPVNFVYGDLSNDHHYHHHHHLGVNVSNSSVSLTLGLHQNDGVCLGERLPVNVARRFGLEECNDAYSLSAYSPQPRPFGKDVSNHLLHDFVG